MVSELLDLIRSRTRQEWLDLSRDIWVEARIWAQEHGEYAAAAGFLCGVFIILFLKFFAFLAAVGVIAAFTVYHLAPAADASVLPLDPGESDQMSDSEGA